MYIEKKYNGMKFKCKVKYFLIGFFSPFYLNYDFDKFCPHCCSRISIEEYFSFGTFTYGCNKCRIKKVKDD